MTAPACPLCRRTKSVSHHADGRHYCHNCKMEFEPDDEGGDYYNDPTKRIEVQEERRARAKRRRGKMDLEAAALLAVGIVTVIFAVWYGLYLWSLV